MIVKNEACVIERCLKSVRPWIDTWAIVDTGSTDGTQAIIQEFFRDVPGELQERPWVDFATNRNQALELARGKSDYLLLIDADDYLEVIDPQFEWPSLELDSYTVDHRHPDAFLQCPCTLLIANQPHWRWEGVVHEALISSESLLREGKLQGLNNVYTMEGSRDREVETALLQAALEKEPNHPRYLFYLAQSYRINNKIDLALATYKKRVALNSGDYEELFYSYYCIGVMEMAKGKSASSFLKHLATAHSICPHRTEPLYYAAYHFMQEKKYETSYQLILRALQTPRGKETCFIENWMEEWGFWMLLGEVAHYLGKKEESRGAYQRVLDEPRTPRVLRAQIETFFDASLSTACRKRD